MSNSPMTRLSKMIWLDAAICAVTGTVVAAASGPVSVLTAIPAPLLLWAGALLLPIAAFMAFVASRRPVPAWGALLVVLGNAGWVAASLALLTGLWFVPNALGIAFVLSQAALVALLARLEHAAMRTAPVGA